MTVTKTPHPTGTGLGYPSSMERDLVRRIAVARGDEPADLVLSGGQVLSVFTGELLEADGAVVGQRVAGVGEGYRGTERLDVSDLILLPGFIDGHMHLEALLPLVLDHGITNCLLCTDDR